MEFPSHGLKDVKKVRGTKGPGNRESVVECSFSEDEESSDCFSAKIEGSINNTKQQPF